jgi:hypothetical protein
MFHQSPNWEGFCISYRLFSNISHPSSSTGAPRSDRATALQEMNHGHGGFSFSKLQTSIQINKNIKVKKKHFIFIIQKTYLKKKKKKV